MTTSLSRLKNDLSACTLCGERFAATATSHNPRPIVWFNSSARILVAGQAPGMRVQKSGVPFSDPSGDRLRKWMGVTKEEFYDQNQIAIVPMAFCFPGYSSKGADLPPPAICRTTWHKKVLQELGQIKLRILVGGHAQKWHLGKTANVQDTVSNWRMGAPGVLPLPHPSWRNTGWSKKNPWFEEELVPVLQSKVREFLNA